MNLLLTGEQESALVWIGRKAKEDMAQMITKRENIAKSLLGSLVNPASDSKEEDYLAVERSSSLADELILKARETKNG